MGIDINSVMSTFLKTTQILIESKDLLEELDSASGDGDLGISMERGSNAVKSVLAAFHDEKDIGSLFIKCALAFNKEAPSTLGTLLSSALLAAGKEVKGKNEISESDVVNLVGVMTNSIMERGKASLGDKTILDAMIPMRDTLNKCFDQGLSLNESLKAAAAAASAGAESTRGIVARMGRAKWIGERAKDSIDGGAVLCSIVINHLSKG